MVFLNRLVPSSVIHDSQEIQPHEPKHPRRKRLRHMLTGTKFSDEPRRTLPLSPTGCARMLATGANGRAVAPEAAVGGNIALVQEGDSITIDAEARLLQLNVSDAELARRSKAWKPPVPRYTRGVLAKYARLVAKRGDRLKPWQRWLGQQERIGTRSMPLSTGMTLTIEESERAGIGVSRSAGAGVYPKFTAMRLRMPSTARRRCRSPHNQ